MLKFSNENAKTKKLRKIAALSQYLASKRKIYSLDLLAGWSCPGAKDCLSKVVILDGQRKIQDGPDCQFRCYAASGEVRLPDTYALHKHNFDLLKSCRSVKQMVDMLESSMPTDLGILRWHSSGGIFNRNYFNAMTEVARNHPDKWFYAYLKNLPVLQRRKMIDPTNGVYLDNFMLTASRGGRFDHLIEPLGLRDVVVINYPEEATRDIDDDDSHAAQPGGSFNLLIHGTQPAGSVAAKAVAAQRKRG
jgi:hypothetical protein